MKNVKMKRINLLFLGVIASTFFAALAFAGGMEEIGKAVTDIMTSDPQIQETGSDISSQNLMGMKVVNNAGEDIGEISEVKAHESSDQVNFVIIAKKGVLGLGGSQYAVPIRAITVSPDAKQATLNVDESLLASAPQQGPEMSADAFQLQLEQHYGIAPAWEAEQGIPSPAPAMKNEPALQMMEKGILEK